MKKRTKKLTLSRETLKTLESPDLGLVFAGEAIGTLLPSCNTYCDITMGCDITQGC
jgi:hypothetical protein